MTSSSETVIAWKDSSGYTRFGSAVGNTYYWDSNGDNPSTSSGALYRFNSTYTSFTFDLGNGNDNFSVNNAAANTAEFNISGAGGNDTLYGWNNDDVIRGGNDQDSIAGGNGDDSIYGDTGDDTLDGSAGNDVIRALSVYSLSTSDNDFFLGGKGDDTIYGSHGSDTIYGNDGNDYLAGYVDLQPQPAFPYPPPNSPGLSDTISGGLGADTLVGSQNDYFNPVPAKRLYGNIAGGGSDGVTDTFTLIRSGVDVTSES